MVEHFGGRSSDSEDELQNARAEALARCSGGPALWGADAVVGVDVDYEVLGSDNGMLMVKGVCTAVMGYDAETSGASSALSRATQRYAVAGKALGCPVWNVKGFPYIPGLL